MNSLHCCCCYGIITESLYGKQRFGDGKISIPSPKWHSRWLLVHPSNSFGPVPAHTPSPRLPSPDFQIIVHFYFCLMLAVEWPSALYSPPSIVESRPVVPRSRRRSFSRPRFLPPRFFLRAFPAPVETGSKFSSLRFSLAKRKPRISAGDLGHVGPLRRGARHLQLQGEQVNLFSRFSFPSFCGICWNSLKFYLCFYY